MLDASKTIINGNGQIKSNRISNFQKQWKLLKANKFLFLVSFIICLGAVFLINRYTKPVYLITSKVSVSEKKDNINQLLLQGTDARPPDASTGLDKSQEIAVLTSVPFLQKTLEALDFKVSYFREDRVGETELYKNAPFAIGFPNSSLFSKLNGKKFEIKFESDQTFFLADASLKDKSPALYNIGKNIIINGCPIVITKTPYFNSKRDINKKYFFNVFIE